jgi:hypothetical protein
MAIFDGKYSWDGTRQGLKDPIAWNPGAYYVKIVDRTEKSESKVMPLKAHICIYAATGEGHSISANPERFAKCICDEFSLELERVIWVEDLLIDRNRYEIVNFVRRGKMGSTIFYRIEKRQPSSNELKIISEALAKLES